VTRVSSIERDLLHVARGIADSSGYEAAEPILRQRQELRGLQRISPGALRLFEETWALGSVRAVARLGGWRRLPRWAPTSSGSVVGRLWEAYPPPALSFSSFTFELCRWLVTTPLDAPDARPLETPPRTMGDELVAYLACAWFDRQALERSVAEQPAIRASVLAWLGFPRMLGSAGTPARGGQDTSREAASTAEDCAIVPERMDALVRDGAVVVHGLEGDLTRRAVDFERYQAEAVLPSTLRRLGEAREVVLDAFVSSLERAGRLDLAAFLVDAAAKLLESRGESRLAPLDPASPLGKRAAAWRAAGAFWRAIGRLGRHHSAARHVGFVDEGYDAAQLLLVRWEGLGNVGFSRAGDVAEAFVALEGRR
jgi:hypothetical protein